MRISIAILFFTVMACNTQVEDHYKSETDWKLNNIKGKVQKMTKWLYSAEIDSNSMLRKGKLETIYTYYFNEKGYLTHFEEEVPEEDYKQVYTYDGRGYVQDFYRVDWGDTMRDDCSLVINDKGWVIEEIWIENGERMQMRYVNGYDDKGRIIETKAYEPGMERPQLRQTYTLDKSGNRLEIKYFDSQNALRQRNEQKFNDDNELTVLTVHRLIGENWAARRHTYQYSEYDDVKNWTRQIAHYNLGDSLNEGFKWTERELIYFE